MENTQIEIRGLDRIEEAFRKAPAMVTRRMRVALGNSLESVAAYARANHRFKSRSGLLEASITTKIDSGVPPVGRVGIQDSLLMVPWRGRTASYGVFVHNGTDAHMVYPDKRKALRWEQGGGFRFSKGHRVSGLHRDPFIYNAGEMMEPKVAKTFERHIRAAIKEAGL